MPSPFPGMNPYLEQDDAWEDFHHRFIAHTANILGDRAGENYMVKIEVRLYLHELPANERRFFAMDLTGVEEERYSWLEILDRRTRRVVTVMELLSPTNKRHGPDRDDYLRKRNLILAGRTNLVEIDLRRGGERPRPPELPKCDYYALVARGQNRPRVGIWPLRLRERLPEIPIPLSPPDSDVLLDLQALFHQVYDAGRYGRYIHQDTPQPPLSEEDAAWAKSILAQAG